MSENVGQRRFARLAGRAGRSWWVTPSVVLVLGIVAMAAILQLQQRADDSKDAQLTLARVANSVNILQSAPFQAARATGGSPEHARSLIDDTRRQIATLLAELRRSSPAPALSGIDTPLRRDNAIIERIYRIGVAKNGYGPQADRLSAAGGRQAAQIQRSLATATKQYDSRAGRADSQAAYGAVVVVALLLGAFGFIFRRSTRARATAERLASENELLLAASRREALTDALTQLPNRRALFSDLDEALREASLERPLLLAIFDLDGFKQYNDTFGHPAGDALLVRLADRLGAAVGDIGRAYRMGGDEFCVLSFAAGEEGMHLLARAEEALSEHGEAFAITASHGRASIPVEESTAVDAVALADQRLYEDKTGRSSASRQTTDVLLTVISERSADLHMHHRDVAQLARLTAEQLDLPEHERRRIELAAALHDIGKTAIPETILSKPAALTEEEWRLIRRHTEIGERIVRAAPALSQTADLIRASHERVDGTGYPDGLGRGQIPLGASIIAVCDAFEAMVSGRPYKAAIPEAEAIAELRRCAGTQFDANVVDAFVHAFDSLDTPASVRVA